MADGMGEQPLAFGRLLCALDLYLNPGQEIAIVGDPAAADTRALLAEVRRRYLPNSVLALAAPGDAAASALIPLLADRGQIDGRLNRVCVPELRLQSAGKRNGGAGGAVGLMGSRHSALTLEKGMLLTHHRVRFVLAYYSEQVRTKD